MTRATGIAFVLLLCLGRVAVLAAEGSGRYREFALGTNVASVATLAGVSRSAATTIHARPALLQELIWRRPYDTSRPVDPVQTIVFSFYNDQLSRMVVDYDRQQTAGMTQADVIEALSTVYGERLLLARKTDGATSAHAGEFGAPLATWIHPGQAIALHVSSYQPAFRLVVISPSLDALAQLAIVDARLQDRREAPQRERDRQMQAAEADRVAKDKSRTANRATFRP